MSTPELIAYIRQQLKMGTAKDSIKQTLSALGWAEGDLNDAFSEIEPAPIAPVDAPVASVETPVVVQELAQSTAPAEGHKGVWAVLIVFLVLLGAGGAYAAYQYDLFSSPTVPAPVPVVHKALPLQPASPVATTTPINASSTTSTANTGNAKSEIDKYGVDLFTLKQGATTVEKMLGTTKTTIIYTRTLDTIERKTMGMEVSGAKTTITITISLTAVTTLPSDIQAGEKQIAADCKVGPTSVNCVTGQKILNYMKTRCVPLTTNEAVSVCEITAVTSAVLN